MAYQPFTISDGSGGFSKLNAPPCRTGAIAAVAGDCYVRFLHTANVTASGKNNAVTGPTGTSFQDGWAYIAEGGSLTYGTERVHETSDAEPVAQIDIYCPGGATITVNQH